MSDYKSGWPPGHPGQQTAPPTSPVPMAPPRSVPPAATPQRIPVPGSGPPAASVPPPLPRGALDARPLQEPVDLDADVTEAADEEESHGGEPLQATEPSVALEPMRPMRRLSIAEPDGSSPRSSAPPPPPISGPPSADEVRSPSPLPPEPPIAMNRLPSFDDPEHHERVSLTPAPPQFTSRAPDAPPSSQDPDEVDTPVPEAPVHVSAPPPFVPPPSPLLPDFSAIPAGDVSSEVQQDGGPAEPAPVPMEEEQPRATSSSPPARRPSRPPPVVPDAVVLAIQPSTYQAADVPFETNAPLDEDEEVRLSETDLEISTTGEPPEVQGSDLGTGGADMGPRSVPEAPVPEVVIAAAASAVEAPSSTSDPKKPPPPKRTAKPALPSATVRRRPWWETLFGDDFARAHRSPTPRQLAREVNFMVTTLSLTQNQVVLDLGCGQGEHTVELTRRGVAVVGYDLSVFQLAMAGDRAQQEGQKINFLQGDMREMAFDAMFDAVVCWDTTFGYFEEDKNVDVARRILASLKPGGSLLIHVMNRDFAAKESPTNIWFEGDGCVCMDDVDFDWITSRLRVKRSLILDDGRSKELHYSVRLYDLSELGRLLHDVGFRVAHVSGDVSTPGAFFGPASPYLIIRAQRP